MPARYTPTLRTRDDLRLTGVHPDLATAIRRILDAMAAFGTPMFVSQSLRTQADQAILYAQGRTTPGKIVTNADGVLKRSNHQPHDDGFGHAVDCAFVDDPDTLRVELYDPAQPWDVYGALGEACGLTWGGRWSGLTDRPHLELRG